MTPNASFLWWQLCCFISTEYTLDYLFILCVFTVTGERVRMREVGWEWHRQRWRERERAADRAGEVGREMDFAGRVWGRSWSWSCKCIFCLHARACSSFWLCFSSVSSLAWSYHITAICAALWIYTVYLNDTVTFNFQIALAATHTHTLRWGAHLTVFMAHPPWWGYAGC